MTPSDKTKQKQKQVKRPSKTTATTTTININEWPKNYVYIKKKNLHDHVNLWTNVEFFVNTI